MIKNPDKATDLSIVNRSTCGTELHLYRHMYKINKRLERDVVAVMTTLLIFLVAESRMLLTSA